MTLKMMLAKTTNLDSEYPKLAETIPTAIGSAII
jgi:hypothetical protein